MYPMFLDEKQGLDTIPGQIVEEQELRGILEVLGELAIKFHSLRNNWT